MAVLPGREDGGPDRFVDTAFRHGPRIDHSSELRRRDYLEQLVVGGFPDATRHTPKTWQACEIWPAISVTGSSLAMCSTPASRPCRSARRSGPYRWMLSGDSVPDPDGARPWFSPGHGQATWSGISSGVNVRDMSDEAGGVVDVHTGGACDGRPGPGGWGAVLRYGRHEREIRGSDAVTTIDRMELIAPVRALESLTRSCGTAWTSGVNAAGSAAASFWPACSAPDRVRCPKRSRPGGVVAGPWPHDC